MNRTRHDINIISYLYRAILQIQSTDRVGPDITRGSATNDGEISQVRLLDSTDVDDDVVDDIDDDDDTDHVVMLVRTSSVGTFPAHVPSDVWSGRAELWLEEGLCPLPFFVICCNFLQRLITPAV